ncbi:hypothetical protein AYI70_g10155 [Smittium culicis]|uniref:Uncharacterized protein n=1 Tax=Smittium culicis TaxID=133412 RepID=A0A1R1X7Z3_9FUNG|nr:hypothetical protein AYI70_g10155 [Smittium culicis]
MTKQNNEKKYSFHHKEPARNSTVLLPRIDGKNYEVSESVVRVASSSRNPNPSAHKRPAPLDKTGSESSVTLTDSSSPSPSPPEPAVVTPPFTGFKRPATPSRFAAQKRAAQSSSPSPLPPSTSPLPSCCRLHR